MTPQERARQIDQEEFAAESAAALQRALDCAAARRAEERAKFEKWLGKAANPAKTTKRKGGATRRPPITKVENPAVAKTYLFRGGSYTVCEIARMSGMSKPAVYMRRQGDRVMDHDEWKAHKAQRASVPHHLYRYVAWNGKSLTLNGWATELGLPYATLLAWSRSGMSIEQIAAKAKTDYKPRPASRRAA